MISRRPEQIETLVVIHGTEPWAHANYKYAYHALSEALPDNAAVLCIDRPVDFFVSPVKRSKMLWSRLRAPRVHVVHPRLAVANVWLPMHELLAAKIPGATQLNLLFMRRQLRSIINELFPQAHRHINWIYHPHQAWAWNVLPKCRRVYQCYDEYSYAPTGEFLPKQWESERIVLKSSELTFVTSEILAARRSGETEHLASFPNGIPEFFLEPVVTRPDPIDTIPAPRILYLGQTYDFVDYALLKQVFCNHPEWQMVFVGGKRDIPGVRLLDELPNVHFAGRRRHEDLPAILAKFDVALLPFEVNPYSSGADTLKLYAYMAGGIPIVSTALPQTKALDGLVRTSASNAPGFEDAIQAALDADRVDTKTRLHEAVKVRLWSTICRDSVVPVLRDRFSF